MTHPERATRTVERNSGPRELMRDPETGEARVATLGEMLAGMTAAPIPTEGHGA